MPIKPTKVKKESHKKCSNYDESKEEEEDNEEDEEKSIPEKDENDTNSRHHSHSHNHHHHHSKRHITTSTNSANSANSANSNSNSTTPQSELDGNASTGEASEAIGEGEAKSAQRPYSHKKEKSLFLSASTDKCGRGAVPRVFSARKHSLLSAEQGFSPADGTSKSGSTTVTGLGQVTPHSGNGGGALIRSADLLPHDAALHGNCKALKDMFPKKGKGDAVNFRDEFGRTPLHYDAIGNSLESARFLVKRGADPNIHDNSGFIRTYIIYIK